MNTPNEQQHRPISIPHLVFGVVFTGIAAVWAIGQATDADLPRTAIAVPLVLIAAGIVGLVASLAGARRRTGPDLTYPDVAEPTVALDEQDLPDTHEEIR